MIVKLQGPLFPSQGQHSPAFLHICGSPFAKISPIMLVLQLILKGWDIKEEEQRNEGGGLLLTKTCANVSILLSIPTPSLRQHSLLGIVTLLFSQESYFLISSLLSTFQGSKKLWLPLDYIRENVLASLLVSDYVSFC